MVEKYQLENPNNARVFIDYRKQKDKVKFEYVAQDNVLKIVWIAMFRIWFSKGLYLALLPTFLMVVYSIQNLEIDNFLKNIFLANLGAFYFFGIPTIVSLIFLRSKKLLSLMPKIQFRFLGGRYYIAKFKSKDIQNNKIVLPLFSNIGLDYKATKEFSKYLERVEIIEHPFNYYVKKKKKPQQYLWRADFFFSKKPKTGELKIGFK